jgi:uncharacterized protein
MLLIKKICYFCLKIRRMLSIFKKTQGIIDDIDSFFEAIDKSSFVFEDAYRHYLSSNEELFMQSYSKIRELEGEADRLKRRVGKTLYTHSLLPEFRGDIMRLLERLDDLIDTLKHNLSQFDVERPYLPESIKPELEELSKQSVMAVREAVAAARTFFRNPAAVRDSVARIALFEREADKIAENIKRKVFQQMPEMELSQKFHIRYFTLHTETLSDIAESIGDMLNIMAIKRFS